MVELKGQEMMGRENTRIKDSQFIYNTTKAICNGQLCARTFRKAALKPDLCFRKNAGGGRGSEQIQENDSDD